MLLASRQRSPAVFDGRMDQIRVVLPRRDKSEVVEEESVIPEEFHFIR